MTNQEPAPWSFTPALGRNLRIGLQEESNIGVADALADHLRTHAGFQSASRVGVPQIMEGDP